MMASCETNRTKAYSEDLRWRMVYQHYSLCKTQQDIAQHLNVDQSTVCRTLSLFNQTGTVSKRSYPPAHRIAHSKLTEVDKHLILTLAIDKPGAYLDELRQSLLDEHGTDVWVGTICKFLHKEGGFTRQKMVLRAKQRSDVLRAYYISDITVFQKNPRYFAFVDETGADGRDRLRKYGYSLRGKPAVSNKLFFRGQRVNAIASISYDLGLLDFHVVIGSVSGHEFLSFLRNSLSPFLQPFDGTNFRSVVILDNASIHHVSGVADNIEASGALIYHLPPYSPDLNPIEHAFSKVKSVLKLNECNWSSLDTETALIAAFNTISVEDCQGWITHCGY